ncbi:hypothetical protein [uncultured Tateyamaria sp.]|uniref:hypothetical protein n=1 Tax=uncultured Tateyamaria sp. TaxID=455651 RepID=UPI00262D5B47|nr:hypothetical protein [uncultured Tateyamaria sp.]
MSVAVFFVFELFWYFLTFAIHPSGVLLENPEDTKEFAIAEAFNAFLAGGIIAACYLFDVWSDATVTTTWINAFFALFVINTIYDLKKNMKDYMGSRS